MNALVAIFWQGVLHATAFALFGIMVYLILRRWSPAAGALGAASTLVVMVAGLGPHACSVARWGIDRFADGGLHAGVPAIGGRATSAAGRTMPARASASHIGSH